jgi:hypothetical protein
MEGAVLKSDIDEDTIGEVGEPNVGVVECDFFEVAAIAQLLRLDVLRPAMDGFDV